jgi:serine/threonine protein kinase
MTTALPILVRGPSSWTTPKSNALLPQTPQSTKRGPKAEVGMTSNRDGDPSHASDTNNERAIAVWNRKFGGPSWVELTLSDEEPFTSVRKLGVGGNSTVHETHVNGIPLALKKIYTRKKPTKHILREIEILGRLSKKRQRHIVSLIGSYQHKQRVGFDTVLLIWPVARTDLAKVLGNLKSLTTLLYVHTKAADCARENKEDPEKCTTGYQSAIQEAMDPLSFLATARSKPLSTIEESAWELTNDCRRRIRCSMGCIAEAIAHLHQNNIRHKDLKPSQILLSSDGLWLTDFGWSADMSDVNSSVTSGGDFMTLKYHAPERANKQPCGRAEDMFGLGCIYLEMSYAMLQSPKVLFHPWSVSGFSFQGDLDQVVSWLLPLIEQYKEVSLSWIILLRDLLAHEEKTRPAANTVLDQIRTINQNFPGLVDTCCHQLLPAETKRPISSIPQARGPEIARRIDQRIEEYVSKAKDHELSESRSTDFIEAQFLTLMRNILEIASNEQHEL